MRRGAAAGRVGVPQQLGALVPARRARHRAAHATATGQPQLPRLVLVCTRRTVCRRAACGARRRTERKGRLFSSARRCPKLVVVARVLHSKVAATLHRIASPECAQNPPLNAAVTDVAIAPNHRTHASTQFMPSAHSVPSLRSIANRGDRENRHVETVSFIASLSIEPNR